MSNYEDALRTALEQAYGCAAELARELSIIYERRAKDLFANVEAVRAGKFPLVRDEE